jgi:hypothetical protein
VGVDNNDETSSGEYSNTIPGEIGSIRFDSFSDSNKNGGRTQNHKSNDDVTASNATNSTSPSTTNFCAESSSKSRESEGDGVQSCTTIFESSETKSEKGVKSGKKDATLIEADPETSNDPTGFERQEKSSTSNTSE